METVPRDFFEIGPHGHAMRYRVSDRLKYSPPTPPISNADTPTVIWRFFLTISPLKKTDGVRSVYRSRQKFAFNFPGKRRQFPTSQFR